MRAAVEVNVNQGKDRRQRCKLNCLRMVHKGMVGTARMRGVWPHQNS